MSSDMRLVGGEMRARKFALPGEKGDVSCVPVVLLQEKDQLLQQKLRRLSYYPGKKEAHTLIRRASTGKPEIPAVTMPVRAWFKRAQPQPRPRGRFRSSGSLVGLTPEVGGWPVRTTGLRPW